MFSRRTYSIAEIKPGLAVFLTSAELREQTVATWPDSAFLPSTHLDKHYFLVLDRVGELAAITPLTSHPDEGGWKRIVGKYGHPGWVGEPTYYHPSQLWPVPVAAVVAAARAAGDLSVLGWRNVVVGEELEAVIRETILWRERHYRRGERPPADGSADNALIRLLPRKLDARDIDRLLWRQFWSQYRNGEIWRELRLSSVFLPSQRVRRITGKV